MSFPSDRCQDHGFGETAECLSGSQVKVEVHIDAGSFDHGGFNDNDIRTLARNFLRDVLGLGGINNDRARFQVFRGLQNVWVIGDGDDDISLLHSIECGCAFYDSWMVV